MDVYDFNSGDPDPEGMGINWEFLIMSLIAVGVLALAVVGAISSVMWLFK